MKFLIIISIIFTLCFAKDLKDVKSLELLNTVYQSYIFSSDLKNAYETAKIGVSKSNSKIWKTRLAQVAIWLGEYDEAYTILSKLYRENRNDRDIEKRYLEISALLKNYNSTIEVLKAKSLRYQNKKDVDDLIYYYNLSGKPLEVAKILKDVYKKSNDADYLTKAAQIYYNHSETNLAKEVLLEREIKHGLDLQSAKILSLCYFDSRDVKGALRVLRNYNGVDKDSEYWKLINDYSWYLRDFETSKEATVELMKSSNFREVDGHRYLILNENSNEEMFLKIWSRYQIKEHLYVYLNNLSKNDKNREVVLLVDSLEEELKYKDEFILMSLINAYIKLKNHDKAKELIDKLVAINPQNLGLWLQKLWVSIDIKDYYSVKKDIEEFKNIISGSGDEYLVLASGYMMLQEIDKAYYYLSKIRKKDFNRELELLYLSILSYNTPKEELDKVQKKIWEELNRSRDFKNKNFTITYLNLAMEFLEPKKFEELLAKYKPSIPKEEYQKILFTYNVKIDNYDGNRENMQKIKDPEPWMELYMAIKENDVMKSQKLMDEKLPLLPYRDAISEAKKANQISLAISLAFNSLNNSQKDYLVDRQFRELILEYGNFYKLMGEYKISENLKTNSYELFNRYYIGDKLFFTQKISTNRYSTKNDLVFKSKFREDRKIEFGLIKLSDRGFSSINIGYKEALENYFSLEAKYNRRVNDKATIEFTIAKNEDSRQSEILTMGGKQDSITTSLNYSLLNSLQWSNSIKYLHIYTQDDKKLADGVVFNSTVTKVLRESHPKLQLDLFVDYSVYNKKGSNNSVIETILREPNSDLIPEDYCSAGFSIRYGNPLIQSKKFRPYSSLTTSLNCNGSINYAAQIGFTKQLFNDDFINIYYLYDKNSNTKEEINNLRFDYKKLY